jgi:hypothetical protein
VVMKHRTLSPYKSSSPGTSSLEPKPEFPKKSLCNEEDSEEEDSASSAPIYDPQRDFFGNSGFGSNDDVPGLEDL